MAGRRTASAEWLAIALALLPPATAGALIGLALVQDSGIATGLALCFVQVAPLCLSVALDVLGFGDRRPALSIAVNCVAIMTWLFVSVIALASSVMTAVRGLYSVAAEVMLTGFGIPTAIYICYARSRLCCRCFELF